MPLGSSPRQVEDLLQAKLENHFTQADVESVTTKMRWLIEWTLFQDQAYCKSCYGTLCALAA